MSQFNWNQPTTPTTPAAPAPTAATPAAPAPASAAFGGPPPQVAQIDPATALRGFGDAPIDIREPFLPVNSAVKARVDKIEPKTGRDTGFAVYVHVTVTAVATAGGAGSDSGLPAKHHGPGAQQGGKYVARISGFSTENGRNFAFSDLKCLMVACLEARGMSADEAAALPPERWEAAAQAMLAGDPQFVGVEILIRSTVVQGKNGNTKLKHLFAPLSQAEGL